MIAEEMYHEIRKKVRDEIWEKGKTSNRECGKKSLPDHVPIDGLKLLFRRRVVSGFEARLVNAFAHHSLRTFAYKTSLQLCQQVMTA